MRRPLTTPLLLVILCSLILPACGGTRRTSESTAPVTGTTKVPTASKTVQVAINTPYASHTPRPIDTHTPISSALEPSETPTPTPFPASTPVDVPDSYKLKLWDQETALRMYEMSKDFYLLSTDYRDLRGFYQLSLLYELFTNYLDLRSDPALQNDLTYMKIYHPGGVSHPPYGLLHTYSGEPLRKQMEDAFNNGSLTRDTMENWLMQFEVSLYDQLPHSQNIIPEARSTWVILVDVQVSRGAYVVSESLTGHFSVFSLYPEWHGDYWSADTLNITDLNGNGVKEIAVITDYWGAGANHMCAYSLDVFEWNGSAFQNLMIDPLYIHADTDYGGCLDITFPQDQGRKYLIQTGTSLNTLCENIPYQEIVTFRWNGQGFTKEPFVDIPEPPHNTPLAKCALDWAIKAGPENDRAINILAEGLVNWPQSGDEEWGPAGRDYLRLKLAVWNIKRGNIERGLVLLQQVRDNPVAADYPLPGRIAGAFLDAYEKEGLYLAVNEVAALYEAEMAPYYKDYEWDMTSMVQEWGFREREWEGSYYFSFTNDFDMINALNFALNQERPQSLNALVSWLKRNKVSPVWYAEGDIDGKGDMDWLVEVSEDRGDFLRRSFSAFLRDGEKIEIQELGYLTQIYDTEPIEIRLWESFRPDQNAVPFNVIQIDKLIYAFRVIQDNEIQSIEYDLSPGLISRFNEDPAEAQDWEVNGDQLFVQYKGREVIYAWDKEQNKLVPTGFAPDLQEENISKAEQAIYFDNSPSQAIEILEGMLAARIWENYIWSSGGDTINPPRVRPYSLYLLGLAYEQAGDSDNAVRAYWQLWHEYPTNPFSIAAQSKLELK